MRTRRGTAAQQMLQDILGREWKLDKEWAGQSWDLWNGRDYVAIRITPDPPGKGPTRVGKRTLVLYFWELEVLEELESVAQIVEQGVRSQGRV